MATASDEGDVLASSVDEGEGAVPPLRDVWPHPPPHKSVLFQITMHMELKEIPHWSYKQMPPLWLSLSMMNKLRIDLLLVFLHLLC